MKALTAAVLAATMGLAQQSPLLEERKSIDLRGVIGRIDHFSADIAGKRLFIGALVNQSIEVVNVETGARIASIPGVPEPQGVFYDAATNRVYAACGKDGSVRVFDAKSFKLLQTINLPGGDADNIRFDAAGRRILVGYRAGAIAILNEQGQKTGDIAVGAHPESFQIDRSGTRLLINVPGKQEVQVADLGTKKVTAHWPIASALQNFAMALDETNRRLFIANRAPPLLTVLNADTGRMVAKVPIVGDADDIFFDAKRARIYVIGGLGYVDVIRQQGPDRYVAAGRVKTAPGARTGLWVPAWGRLFVAKPLKNMQPARILVFQPKESRPAPK